MYTWNNAWNIVSMKDFLLVLLVMVIWVLLTVVTSITPFSYDCPSCLKERITSLGASLYLLNNPSSISPSCYSVVSRPFPHSSLSLSRYRQVSKRFDASPKTPAFRIGYKTSHMRPSGQRRETLTSCDLNAWRLIMLPKIINNPHQSRRRETCK